MMIPDLSQLLSFSPSATGFGGLFGAQTASQGGGLFGGLMGEGVSGEGSLFGNVLSSMLGESGLVETLSAAEELNLEELENSEEAELAIIQVTQVVTVVYEEFTMLSSSGVNFDDLNSVDSLSAAYQQLGMSQEEADSRATRLTVMFMLLDNRISTADLVAGLSTDQIAVKQQRTFIQIEQSIQAFSVASVGSSGQLSSLLAEGQNLMNGGLSDAELQAALAGAGEVQSDADLALASTDGENPLEGNLFGRVSEIFNKLADRASQHPEGKQLAAQLQEIAQATQNISDKVVKDGGLPNVQKALETPTLQSNSQQAVQAQIAEDRPLPSAKAEREIQANARAQEVAADEANLGKGAGDKPADAARNNTAMVGNGRPQALPEPPVPTFVMRPTADGGVEVVDPATGEVIQSSQGNLANGSNAQAADGPMAQSRGLETAQQVRLAQQVRVHVRTLAAHNGGQIVVNLNPKELGRVQVRLEIEEGVVKGAITVQRPDVAESIAKDMRALEQALADVGLELAQDGIAIQLENHSAGDSNSQDSEGKRQTGTGFADTSSEALSGAVDGEESAGRWMNPDRLLDVEA